MLRTMQKAPKPASTLYVKEWRKARGLTQHALADAIGRDKSVVSKIEGGQVGVTGDNIDRIAGALGIHPAALYAPPPEGTRTLREEESAQVGEISTRAAARSRALSFFEKVTAGKKDGGADDIDLPAFRRQDLVGERADLPIYASAQGGPDGMTVDLENPIDWVKRPEPLFNVRAGFGMYVVGASMEPAYRQGDMILVHPNRPANAGDDVLIVKVSENGDTHALVKCLLAADDKRVRVRQYNPAKDFEIPRAGVANVYLIVGKYNRR